MKTLDQFKRLGILIVAILVVVPMVNAQARYKHMPRVKVGAKKTEVPVTIEKETTPLTIMPAYPITEAKMDVIDEEEVTMENTAVTSNSNEIVINQKKTPNVTQHSPIYKTKIKGKSPSFGDQIKKKSKILNVSDVKKNSDALGYLLWFFIVFFICVAFFVLAFIFFTTFFTIYPVFLTLGIAVFLIAALILIFGLTGLI